MTGKEAAEWDVARKRSETSDLAQFMQDRKDRSLARRLSAPFRRVWAWLHEE
jgi:hypothetical protein